MADTATDVIAQALENHRPAAIQAGLAGLPSRCFCGADALWMGTRWETHLADVTVAALTQAGILGTQPITTRTDVMPEARWRAAALEVVTAWTVPGALPQLHQAAREQLDTHWPSLARPIRRLVQAKADLLEGRP